MMVGDHRPGPPYARPPITEAVIEIRVSLPSEVTLETLAAVHDSVRATYPARRNRYHVEGLIEGYAGGEGVSAQARQSQIGFQCLSSDGRQIALFGLSQFSFSRLAPYEGWEPFKAETQRLWGMYRAATRPTAINRVGVRYINRLDLPLPFGDFNEFLRTVPEVAPDLPQGLSAYFMRLEIPHDEAQALLVINQALVPSEDTDVASVILDLDAIRQAEISRGRGRPLDLRSKHCAASRIAPSSPVLPTRRGR